MNSVFALILCSLNKSASPGTAFRCRARNAWASAMLTNSTIAVRGSVSSGTLTRTGRAWTPGESDKARWSTMSTSASRKAVSRFETSTNSPTTKSNEIARSPRTKARRLPWAALVYSVRIRSCSYSSLPSNEQQRSTRCVFCSCDNGPLGCLTLYGARSAMRRRAVRISSGVRTAWRAYKMLTR